MRLLGTFGLVATTLLIAGCGNAPSDEPDSTTTTSAAAPAPEPAGARLPPPPCASGLANCEEASGVVLYVERVDPDGDGDAHVVLASAEGITAPGITVVDIEAELRPDPLPGAGDQVAAAGPVYTGSYGQRQIEATALRFRDG
jgi:hypothetical protein